MTANLTSSRGYLSAHAFGNRSPIVNLECGGDLATTNYKRWKIDDINNYLLYYAGGQPIDSFFQAFLFSPNRARSGRFLNPLFSGFEAPTNKDDWSEWLNELLSSQINLQAVELAVESAGLLCKRADVWVTLPYPELTQSAFGMIENEHLDFSRTVDRTKALQWWIEQFVSLLNKHTNSNITFRGFCWARATILDYDLEIVKTTAETVHRHGLQFMYKTHYGSAHALDWDTLGFDLAVLHPNYYGKTSYSWNWIDNAANFSVVYHTGLVLTYGRGLLYDENHIYDYLNRGLSEYRGYMNEAFLLFNFDGVSLSELYRTRLPQYIEIYSFVKGIYSKHNYPGITY